MNVYEVTYKADDGKERKVHIVATHSVYASLDISKRRYPGSKKEVVSTLDQGAVFVAEPFRPQREVLLSRTVEVGAILGAIEKEIADIEVDLERHTKAMKQVADLKERLSKKEQSA